MRNLCFFLICLLFIFVPGCSATEETAVSSSPSPTPFAPTETAPLIPTEQGAIDQMAATSSPHTDVAITDPIATEAISTLDNYLNSLYWGDNSLSEDYNYQTAVALYGGSYDVLIAMNPYVDPTDQAALLRNACEANGFQCLRLQEVLSAEVLEDANETTIVSLTVSLMNDDGSIFTLGPCCGDDGSASTSEFVFNLQITKEGNFDVLDLPPLLP